MGTKKVDKIISAYMAKIGALGGKKSRRKLTKKQAKEIGAMGGQKSRRTLTRAQALAMVRARERKKNKETP